MTVVSGNSDDSTPRIPLPDMPTRESPPCTHELRPGTTICLHCRHDALVAARARLQRLVVRSGIGLVTVGILAIGAMLARPLVRDGGTEEKTAGPEGGTRTPALATPASLTTAAGDAAMPTVAPPSAPASVAATPTLPPAREAPATAPAVERGAANAAAIARTPSPRPVVSPGVTALRDGMSAERVGDTVTVVFDTELARTRRPQKFEGIVRATLPMVYGAVADSALAATPAGAIAGAGDLFTELPARGVRLRAPGGTTLLVTPATRPGRDGPLVVSYRAIPQR